MLFKLLLAIAVTAAIIISYQFTPSSGTPTSDVGAAPNTPADFIEPSSSPSLSAVPVGSFPQDIVSAELPPPPTSLLTRLLSPFIGAPSGEPKNSTPAPVAVANPWADSVESNTTNVPDEKTVFSKLWPDYYRASLSDTRDFLVSGGYLSENPNYSLTSEDSIWTFLNDYAAAYRSIASLSNADYNQLKTNLAAAPALKDAQRQEIIGDLSFSFRRLLVNFFNTPVARASWVSSAGGGLCYRDDAPGNIAVGPSSPAVSCNSGLWRTSHGSIFRADCGPYASSCNVHFGCLNQTCRGFSNALYDPATSMCGCG